MKPHIILVEAETEFSDAFEWYESRSPGLGRRFIDAATDTLRRVCASPRSFPITQGSIRTARVFRFPYSLYFTDEEDAVVLYAVFHERRDPRARIGRRRPGA